MQPQNSIVDLFAFEEADQCPHTLAWSSLRLNGDCWMGYTLLFFFLLDIMERRMRLAQRPTMMRSLWLYQAIWTHLRLCIGHREACGAKRFEGPNRGLGGLRDGSRYEVL
jgi:hypothetical protein